MYLSPQEKKAIVPDALKTIYRTTSQSVNQTRLLSNSPLGAIAASELNFRQKVE